MRAPLGTLHLAVEKFLWRSACYEQLRVSSCGREPVRFGLRIRFGADYADIFEVRGQRRVARGRNVPPEVSGARVILAYRGLDQVVRRTILQFAPGPAVLKSDEACWELTLVPGEERSLSVEIGCERGGSPFVWFRSRERTTKPLRSTAALRPGHAG